MNKVLVIDDDRMVRHMVKTILAAPEYEVFEAENGKEGLEKAVMHAPSAILLDVMMPEMNGWQFIENFRKIPRFAFIPVIFMTSMSSLLTRARVFRNGADDFMQKPFPAAEVSFRVRKAINYGKRIAKDFSKNSTEEETLEFFGTLNELGIASFLLFLESDQKTGNLTVTSGQEECTIIFSKGVIVDAKIKGKENYEYTEIVYELLKWSAGKYKFSKTDVVFEEDKTRLPITPLIIEGARRIDEDNL